LFGALSKIWWLLALCGVVDAIIATLNLLMMDLDRSVGWDMSVLAIVAGACTIIAAVWNSGRGNSWLLSLHGLALGTFGLIGVSPLVRGPVSFRPISLLFVLMAVSVGAFAWRTARTLSTAGTDRWFLIVSAMASICFAFSFIAVGFGWVRLTPPHSYWIWMSSYFGLCAIFLLYVGLQASGALSIRFRRSAPSPVS
jgi:hypothetical protein